jgi:hypothetical protein
MFDWLWRGMDIWYVGYDEIRIIMILFIRFIFKVMCSNLIK